MEVIQTFEATIKRLLTSFAMLYTTFIQHYLFILLFILFYSWICLVQAFATNVSGSLCT